MGRVYLVGAGPGDPGLLTLRAARLLRRAEIVVHDALISREILDLVPAAAERIDVGKRAGGKHTPQRLINRVLVEAAARARVVVRLKGGDPFVFGRGGEEALALREAGVRFEIVPGVTAAVGVAAYAGIPLTHRDVSSAVTLVTGHECAAGGERVDWDRLGRSSETLVVYMGVNSLPVTSARLIAAGRSPETPAAIIQSGTCPGQRTVTAPLSRIAAAADEAGIAAPALVVIGPVAALRDRLAWFERRPLFGLRVLVPRSRTQRSRLARNLAALGADVLEAPRMSIEPGASPALGAAVRELDRFAWVALTSPTAVERFWGELLEAGLDARALAGVRFACFGTTTGAALLKHGIRPDFARPTFAPAAAGALAEEAPIDGARVLFPREAGAASPLAAALAGLGALVDEVEAYRERLDAEDAAEVRRRLEDGGIDVIAFASSRTVRSFAEAVGPEVGNAAVAAIGAGTARTALSLGLPVHHLPEEATLRGLIEGLRELARSTRPRPHAHAGAPARRARVAL